MLWLGFLCFCIEVTMSRNQRDNKRSLSEKELQDIDLSGEESDFDSGKFFTYFLSIL